MEPDLPQANLAVMQDDVSMGNGVYLDTNDVI